jgi:hypothetical protein
MFVASGHVYKRLKLGAVYGMVNDSLTSLMA